LYTELQLRIYRINEVKKERNTAYSCTPYFIPGKKEIIDHTSTTVYICLYTYTVPTKYTIRYPRNIHVADDDEDDDDDDDNNDDVCIIYIYRHSIGKEGSVYTRRYASCILCF
jgi:hypothetical protein